MDHFGLELHVSNKDNLSDIKNRNLMSKLRKCVYNFILDREESSFFDIDIFNRTYVKNMNKTNDMINKIVIELNSLGWNTYIGFGGTGLYIYSSEDLPRGAY
jgi:hypothetical protein